MYKINDIVKCTITGFKEYGIFVKVDQEYDGLIHISEISSSFVRNVTDYGEIGEEIYALVIAVDESTKHLKLSIKNINYKATSGDSPIKETRTGFLPLKEHLDEWIQEKVEYYKNL